MSDSALALVIQVNEALDAAVQSWRAAAARLPQQAAGQARPLAPHPMTHNAQGGRPCSAALQACLPPPCMRQTLCRPDAEAAAGQLWSTCAVQGSQRPRMQRGLRCVQPANACA